MFFVPCDNWKTLVVLKDCCYCEIFSAAILSFSLKKVLKKVHVLHYLHNNSAVLILMLMQSSKMKASYTIPIHTGNNFIADFFMIKFFTLILWHFHTFLHKWVFLQNSKDLWKHVFTQYCRAFINSLCIKGEFLYTVRTKLHIKVT